MCLYNKEMLFKSKSKHWAKLKQNTNSNSKCFSSREKSDLFIGTQCNN